MEKADKKFIIIIFLIIYITILIISYVNNLTFGKRHQKKIYFGQTIDLDNNIVSQLYFKGFQLAFQSINRIGGINGYSLEIILYNDKYEKNLAIKNGRLLVDYFNVLAIIGSFGTPTTIGILEEVINDRPITVVAPYSGSGLLEKKFDPHLILIQNTAKIEFELMLKHMVSNNIKKISIIYQNDDYGTSYLNGIINFSISKNIDLEILSIGSYERNSNFLYNTYKSIFDIPDPINNSDYKNSKIFNELQAVVLFVSQTQLPYILGFLKKIKPSLFIYYCFFPGNYKDNFKVIGNNTENVYQTLLNIDIKNGYPLLYSKLKEEINYYELMNKEKILGECNSLYQGFYSGLFIVEVLKNIPDLSKLNRKNFNEMFYKIQNFDIYGLKIGPFIEGQNNKGLTKGFLTKIVNQENIIIDSM